MPQIGNPLGRVNILFCKDVESCVCAGNDVNNLWHY